MAMNAAARIKDPRVKAATAEMRQRSEMPDIIPTRRGGFLDLQGISDAILHDQQINLALILVADVVKRRPPSAVPVALEQLDEHPGHQDRAGHGSSFQGLRTGPFGEVGRQAGVKKIELGRLDESFAEIG